MMRANRLCWLLTAFAVPFGLANAQAQTFQDVVTIAGEPYVRIQQPLVPEAHFADFSSLAATPNGVFSTFMYDPQPVYWGGMRRFGAWGDEQLPLQRIAPDQVPWYVAGWVIVDWRGGNAHLGWVAGDTGYFSRQTFDIQGAAVSPVNTVAQTIASDYERMSIAGNGLNNLTAAIVNGMTNADLHFMLCNDAGGVLNTATFPNFALGPQSMCVAMQADGSAVIAYGRGSPGFGPRYISTRRVEPDLTLGPVVNIAQYNSNGSVGLALAALSDGTYWLESRNVDTNEANIRRLDAGGVAIGNVKPINGSVAYMAATPDGRFAIQLLSTTLVQLYDAAAEPLGQPFDYAIRPYPQSIPGIGGSGQHPIAYTEDGTLWLCWEDFADHGGNTHLVMLKPVTPGDLNGDGRLDNFDIDPFVMALVDPAAYQATYDLPADALGDFDGDGRLTNFDIDPFVDALLGAP